MDKQHYLLIGCLMLLSIAVGPWGEAAGGDRFTEIAKKARAEYTLAQEKWQRGLAELVIRKNPEFAAVASAQRDLQFAYIEARTARFAYLLKHDPSRIVLTKGLSTFSNFEWSDNDTKALIEADPSYAALEGKVSALRKKNDEQPDWPRFREYFRNTLSKSKEYQVLLKEFMSRTKQVEGLLQSYRSGVGSHK
jgi:hypothetical protein